MNESEPYYLQLWKKIKEIRLMFKTRVDSHFPFAKFPKGLIRTNDFSQKWMCVMHFALNIHLWNLDHIKMQTEILFFQYVQFLRNAGEIPVKCLKHTNK